MLCEALAGATLMLASTVKLCLVINKYRFLPLHSWTNSNVLLDNILEVLYTVKHLWVRHFGESS